MPDSSASNIRRHLEALVGERNLFTSESALENAASYIENQFRMLNLEVESEPVSFEGKRSRNVLGRMGSPGGAAFVLAAHYDTAQGSPGADDNASAVAALIEVARMLRGETLAMPLLFAAFTLEEYGFIGSRHHIEQAGGKNFSGMISLEMVGYFDAREGSQAYPPYVDAARYPSRGDFIAVVGNEPSARLTGLVSEGMRRASPGLPVEQLVVPGSGERFSEVTLSDHSPFWQNGTPAVMITDTAFLRNPNYHQPTDTLATLDIAKSGSVARGVAGFLKDHLDA